MATQSAYPPSTAQSQPWFTGVMGMFGPSYVGYTQWAIADVPEIGALATVVTASSFHDPIYAGDSFSLWYVLGVGLVLGAMGVAAHRKDPEAA